MGGACCPDGELGAQGGKRPDWEWRGKREFHTHLNAVTAFISAQQMVGDAHTQRCINNINSTAAINCCESCEPDTVVWDESKIIVLQSVPTETLQFNVEDTIIIII